MNKSYDLSDLVWQIILESIEKPTPEFIALIDEKIKYYSSKISNKIVSEEYYRFFMKKKSDYIWNLKSNKKKVYFNKEKIQEFTNEKLIIIFMIFENQLVQNNLEQVSVLKFKNENLNKIKDDLFRKVFVENINVDSSLLKSIVNQFFPIDEINSFQKTHLGGLDKKEKAVFFQQILINLKLPELQTEVENLKKLIVETSDEKKQSELISKYNKFVQEIKNIKNKELE